MNELLNVQPMGRSGDEDNTSGQLKQRRSENVGLRRGETIFKSTEGTSGGGKLTKATVDEFKICVSR